MKRIISSLAIAALAFGSTSLMAQSITVGTNSGLPGATVIVPVNFATGGTAIGSIDVEVAFDNTNFSAASIDCSTTAVGQNGKVCSGSLAGGKFKGSFSGDGVNAFTAGLLFNLSFTIAGAATTGDKLLDAVSATLTCGTPAGDDIGPPCTITLTDGKVTVSAGPQPLYASTPSAATGVNFGTVAQEAVNPSTNVVINNAGGAVSTTLTGTCSKTADPDAVFTLSGTTNFSVPQAGPTNTVTVSCNASGAVGAHTGTMSCSHNGSNASPQDYNLSCTIAGPAYTSNPVASTALNFATTEQNDPNPTKSISVTNSGFAGTKLDVTCTDTVDPDSVFSVTSGSPIVDLLTTGPAKTVTVTCDATKAVGVHTGTLSCSHNGTNTTPATYALSCEISPLGAAIYASTPGPGSTINLTPSAVAKGTNVPTKPLFIKNDAAIGKSDLLVQCGLTGDSQISQAPLTTSQFTLAPQATATANFDCDTASVGNYTATYKCDYASQQPTLVTGKAYDGSASYTVQCDVRDPESVVDPAPAGGTPQEAVVPPGGSHTFSFVFNETADEGVDGAVETCKLLDGSNYAIISPTFTAIIPAGGSVTVQVKGTDPGGVDSFADTLECTYSDTDHPYNGDNEFGQTISWPLNLLVGGDATFRVTKEFTDGDNPTQVKVTISCDTGLPLIQSQYISETRDVNFVVTNFDTGALDCSITEDLSDPALVGYTPTYYTENSGQPFTDSCSYAEVAGGDKYDCYIVNDADPVPVEITKDWIIEGMGGNQVNQHFKLTLYCDGQIVDGYQSDPHGPVAQVGCGPSMVVSSGKSGYSYQSCLELPGDGDTTFTPEVIPQWPSTHCWVDETIYDDSVEVDNGCGDINVSHGQGDSCLITNTVFFEGIPTLNQYGMVILALLMLGVGMVGFRRFI